MANLKKLAGKGNGVLVKTGDVWSYPGAPIDPSGTNLRLPLDYVSDAEVQAALGDGTLVAAVSNPFGFVSSVRLAGEGVVTISAGLAGSAELGTELPANSRVELDAGRTSLSQAEVERAAVESLAPIVPKAQTPVVEGAATKAPAAASDGKTA